MNRRLLALVAAAGVAAATSDAMGDGAAAPEARAHFERGDQLFKMGEFDDAIVEFKRAYELSPAPGLLFNIAQAYRAKKDRERALYFYTTYLREDPNAPEREYVEERIKELTREPEPTPPLAEEPTPAPSPAAPAVPPAIQVDGPDPARGRGLRIAGAITAGGGVALGVAAVFFGARAVSASHEISSAFEEGATWNADRTALWNRGRRDQTTAVVLGIAGGAAIATGSILYFMGLRAERDSLSVVAVPIAGGGRVALRCGF